MKILIADDHRIVSVGVERLIKEVFPTSIIHTTINYSLAIKRLGAEEYDLLILDFNMPGMNSFQRITEAKAAFPSMKILIYSSFREDLYRIPCINAGADGYLSKEDNTDEIIKAIKDLMYNLNSGTSEFSIKPQSSNVPVPQHPQLSKRELEVYQLLVQGNGILEIANSLQITVSSASTYKRRLFQKLAVQNIAELIALYVHESPGK